MICTNKDALAKRNQPDKVAGVAMSKDALSFEPYLNKTGSPHYASLLPVTDDLNCFVLAQMSLV